MAISPNENSPIETVKSRPIHGARPGGTEGVRLTLPLMASDTRILVAK